MEALSRDERRRVLSCYSEGRYEDAYKLAHALTLRNPADGFGWKALGVVCNKLGRFEESRRALEHAARVVPADHEVHLNLGILYRRAGHLALAESAYLYALELAPDTRDAWVGLGNVLKDVMRLDEAEGAYRRALRLDPGSATAKLNLALLMRDTRRHHEAEQLFRSILDVDPAHDDAAWNLALLLLTEGRLEEGWPMYEWRWKNQALGMYRSKRTYVQPLWLGDESLSGKTILLYAEQGLGDTLQFCRYAPLVAERGARVTLEVPHALYALLRTLDGVSDLVSGESPPQFDYHCPLMSLPLAFGTNVSTIPWRGAYLKTEPGKRAYWQKRLGPWTKPRVGLVWAGGFRPAQPELWAVNLRRNIPLEQLAPLRNERIDFFSLQKGEAAEEELHALQSAGWNGPRIVDCTSELSDFSDTAALVDNLDLVISVDTSTAHLVGALDKPIWILNRYDSCWRWMLERSDSPWYPSARLYRQPRPGDWEDVIGRVRDDLAALATGIAL